MGYCFDSLNANVFYRGQAETDTISDNSKIDLTLVNIGRKNGNAHILALRNVLNSLVLTPHVFGQQGGHELHGIVGLEKGGLIGYHGVSH